MENLSKRDKQKLVHEKEIIAAAEKVFCIKGYEDASMDGIAQEAQLTKRTVYQYFESKEDLYFAVALKGFKRLFAKIREVEKKELTGFEKIEQICKNYYRFYKANPEIFRLIHYWGYVKKKSTDSKRKNELVEFNNTLFRDVTKVIAEGKEDGSISFEVDSEKTAYSLVFLMTGFFNQLSTTGDHFTQDIFTDGEEVSLFTIDFITKTLKKNKAIITRKGTA